VYFVEIINGRFAVYRKTTGAVALSKTDSSFWGQTGINIPSGQSVSDPRVLFDPISQRWFASAILFDQRTTASNNLVVAVSGSADPTGPWHGVSFVGDPVNGNFSDFPTLGVDANGVYLSANMFGPHKGPAVGTMLFSIPKADLMLAAPTVANMTSFGLLSYGAYGAVLQPVFNPNGTNSATLVAVESLGEDHSYHSHLVISAITNAAGPGSASLSASSSVEVDPFFIPLVPPQPSPTATNLDAGDSRISAVVRQVGNVIYATQCEEVNAHLDSNLDWVGQAAIRWYKINAADYSIIQSGTLSDLVMHYFYPSIAANADGTIVIGCNGCSSNSFVSSYAFVGETTDGVTTFGPPLLLKSGSASYLDTVTDNNRSVSRWGDYSATSLDPADPTRFWTIQMLPIAQQTYITQITSIRAVKQPVLTLASAPPNLTLSWPVSVASFTVLTTSNLGPAAAWGPADATYATNGSVVSATVPSSADGAFFRLGLQ
jgi:hypothetical protein